MIVCYGLYAGGDPVGRTVHMIFIKGLKHEVVKQMSVQARSTIFTSIELDKITMLDNVTIEDDVELKIKNGFAYLLYSGICVQISLRDFEYVEIE